MPREPQSYGSNEEWVTGRTDQNVNDPKATPSPEHRPFYDDRRESETSHSHQGGKTSDVQLAENAQPAGRAGDAFESTTGINTHEGGAKRGSYFRKRDYE
ncbi:MAG TPA: hypothetical protein VHW00_17810 [Thermoanaerobaculia bacterium]|nr:hypothetical protein [Thermoanaerobaculia bacterium]